VELRPFHDDAMTTPLVPSPQPLRGLRRSPSRPALCVRFAAALTIGASLLDDPQVLRDLWLVPLRDCVGLALWAWSYAEDKVIWRGERLTLRNGLL